MTHMPLSAIKQHCIALNAAMSDPEGWSIHPQEPALQYRSGLELEIHTDRSMSHIPHTLINFQYTAEQLGSKASDTSLEAFSLTQETHTFTVLKFEERNIRSSFPGRLPADSVCYETIISDTFYVFQQFLRLNFTQAGKDALRQARSEVMALILMDHPEASGKWQVDLEKKEARPRWSPSTQHLLSKLDIWNMDPLLDVGFPARPMSGEHGYEISYFLDVSLPTTAHARAALLYEFTNRSSAPMSSR